MLSRHHRLSVAVSIIASLGVAATFLPLIALAQSQGAPEQIVPNTCSGIDCDFCDLVVLAQNILNFAMFAIVVWAAIRFAMAGWYYLTNAASVENRKRANSILWNVTVGLVVVLTAWLLIDTIMKGLTGGEFGPWNEACDVTASSVSGGQDIRTDFGSF